MKYNASPIAIAINKGAHFTRVAVAVAGC